MKSKEDVFLEVLEMYERAMRTINRIAYEAYGEEDAQKCANENLELAVKHMMYEYKEAE